MPSPGHSQARSRGIVDELMERGFCVLRDILPASLVAALDADLAPHFERTPFGEGAFYGATTKRFGRLLLRSSHAAALVRHPSVLAAVEEILAPYRFYRIHNSHLINLSYIKKYLRGDGGQVILQNDEVIDVARRKKEEFLKLIS